MAWLPSRKSHAKPAAGHELITCQDKADPATIFLILPVHHSQYESEIRPLWRVMNKASRKFHLGKLISAQLVLQSSLPYYMVLEKIHNGIDRIYRWFPTKIMYGRMFGDKFYGSITPSGLFSKALFTAVDGKVTERKDQVEIEIQLSFGIVSSLILVIWFLPVLVILFSWPTLADSITIFLICAGISVVFLIILRAKMECDKKCLRDWLEGVLNTK